MWVSIEMGRVIMLSIYKGNICEKINTVEFKS